MPSITSRCNLHCAGCYSRCSHATTDAQPESQLTADEWRSIFREADVVTGVCDRYRDLVGRDDYYRAYLGIER